MAILKLPRFWPAEQLGRVSASGAATGARAASTADGLDAFGSEVDPLPHTSGTAAAPVPSSRRAQVSAVARWIAVILLSAAIAVLTVFWYQRRVATVQTTGTVTIETNPAGLEVALAGKPLGRTPLTTTLAPGSYDMEVGAAASRRTIKVSVAAGSSVVQRVEFAEPLPATGPTAGGLRVQTEPARLPVSIDGAPQGVSPIAMDGLEPGQHEVAVRATSGTIRRTVSIKAGETVSLIVSPTTPAADPTAVSAGWMSVSAPIALQLREGGKLIGTSESDRLMLTAGDHDIEFTNDALGFSTRKVVRIAPGRTAATRIDLPGGLLSINAQPWAEVWIDGERIGETPVGNISRPIGIHEVIFRHPELGERRETVVITVGKPARIGVDLRKK